MKTTRTEYLTSARQYKKTYIKLLKKEKLRGGIMICKHNTICALRLVRTKRVDLVVDFDAERNVVSMLSLDEHLAVPRFENSSAQEWMKEDFDCGYYDDKKTQPIYEKTLLSEDELRQELKAYLLSMYETIYRMAMRMKEMNIEEL